jgi:hypothetical protein
MLSQEAATLKEKCPFTPIPMLIATRGISARPERFLNPLVDAMKAEPNFMYYYEEGVIYELPRWHGTAEWSAELFLKRHADEIGGEEGDVLYARIAWLMQTSGMFSNAIKECGFSSDRVEKGFQALERRYPDALSVKSMHALLGGFVGGREVARGLIDKLDGKVDLSIWTVDQFKEQVRFAYALEKQKPVAPTQVAGPVKKS